MRKLISNDEWFTLPPSLLSAIKLNSHTQTTPISPHFITSTFRMKTYARRRRGTSGGRVLGRTLRIARRVPQKRNRRGRMSRRTETEIRNRHI
jgi:hypothetical protein